METKVNVYKVKTQDLPHATEVLNGDYEHNTRVVKVLARNDTSLLIVQHDITRDKPDKNWTFILPIERL